MSGARDAGSAGAPPLLLIDAGNSRIKWALVAADGARLFAGAANHADAPHAQASTETRDFADWAALPTPGGAWISNVAGAAVAQRIDAALDAHWPGLARTVIRSAQQQCGVTNGYTTPEALGSDRWAGMIGARAAFPGEPLLIATFGTATTLEALRADGTFIGGLIAPGWTLMMRSLGEHTAQLPVLDAHNAPGLGDAAQRQQGAHGSETAPLFATDTKRSIAAGCALAQAGLVERAWADLQDAWKMPVRLVVSGGAATEATAALKVPHTRHDALVLAGLALIAMQS
ncbi:type III pantothenate kinase [Paraburkholderia eburnea]|uniref:Type III pantothenate kinase n=1 Tax=Paraburkholderia eburnea TaxID=1189126 RepID=A0A2S4MNH7_9BURK|nr:type III pantothenate kinase [Paraburkholderia eburnea]POR56313.1 type III pantothenate kinase [Paraburkholderia eburnea]PRZ27440.1 type III pantothenate kinase [Paraburkholderia eburnea]